MNENIKSAIAALATVAKAGEVKDVDAAKALNDDLNVLSTKITEVRAATVAKTMRREASRVATKSARLRIKELEAEVAALKAK